MIEDFALDTLQFDISTGTLSQPEMPTSVMRVVRVFSKSSASPSSFVSAMMSRSTSCSTPARWACCFGGSSRYAISAAKSLLPLPEAAGSAMLDAFDAFECLYIPLPRLPLLYLDDELLLCRVDKVDPSRVGAETHAEAEPEAVEADKST